MYSSILSVDKPFSRKRATGLAMVYVNVANSQSRARALSYLPDALGYSGCQDLLRVV